MGWKSKIVSAENFASDSHAKLKMKLAHFVSNNFLISHVTGQHESHLPIGFSQSLDQIWTDVQEADMPQL